MTLRVVPYAASWKADFAAVPHQLVAVLAEPSVQIEHIGSTSVQGLCAKPVIDVLTGAASLAVFESARPRLEGAGFPYISKYEAELPKRRDFVRPPGPGLRVHVHGVVIGSPGWRAHLAFRDALQDEVGLREACALLKLERAARHRDDKAACTVSKGPVIQRACCASAGCPTGEGRVRPFMACC